MKKIIALLFVLIMVLSSVEALAARAADGSYYDTETLEGLPAFKFKHYKKGIGFGVCPVYSAPSKNAYRASNGKASVDTNAFIDVGGYDAYGWLLVRYETNRGNWRVGWIPPEYVYNHAKEKGFRNPMDFHFGHIRQVAEEPIEVTDNNKQPYTRGSVIGEIGEGETYYVIGYYNYTGYELWYVEFNIDGQTAYGFIYR